MFSRLRNRLPLGLVTVAALAALTLSCVQPLAAADLSQLDTSLKVVPADVAFYSTMLRNREQFEAIKNSNAWAKIVQMPVVQMGLAMYGMQAQSPGTPAAKADEVLHNPEVLKVAQLLGDMTSDEIFFYGDKSFTDFVQLMQEVNSASRFGPAIMQITEKEHSPRRDMQATAVISALAEDVKLINVPNFVVGFKLKSTDLAKEQLIKLEAIANLAFGMNDVTKGRFKKTNVAGEDCLVLELDGSMIPWDQVPLDRFREKEAEEGDVDKIVKRIKECKLVVTLGVRGNYLLATIGSSVEPLEKFGKGDHLVDRPELKPLAKFADKRLVSIGYLSEAVNQQISRQQKDIDELLGVVNEALPETSLTDEQKARIGKDAKALAEDLKTLTPNVGGVMGLSFLTDRGVEGYQYTWGEHRTIDSTQPLSLLQHVGGSPLLGIVARSKVDLKAYDIFTKWAKVGYGYFKDFGLPTIPEKDREKVQKFLEAALPLFEQLDKANRDMLFPALADGQFAFVVDGKLASSHFIDKAPATEKPMPMVEPAFVIGVSNAELLKKGLSEYRSVINGLIDAARNADGQIPPNIVLPEPQVTDTSNGKVYSYPLPEAWGVDKQILPNMGIGEKIAVISLSHNHTNRLLTSTPLGVGGLLDKTDRPIGGAAWFEWATLLDTARPWIDLAVVEIVKEKINGDEAVQKNVTAQVQTQVHTVVDVLKAFKNVTDETYLEDGVLVNHTLLEIHDVAK